MIWIHYHYRHTDHIECFYLTHIDEFRCHRPDLVVHTKHPVWVYPSVHFLSQLDPTHWCWRSCWVWDCSKSSGGQLLSICICKEKKKMWFSVILDSECKSLQESHENSAWFSFFFLFFFIKVAAFRRTLDK